MTHTISLEKVQAWTRTMSWISNHWISQHERTNGYSFLSCSKYLFTSNIMQMPQYDFPCLVALGVLWNLNKALSLASRNSLFSQTSNIKCNKDRWDVKYPTWAKEGVLEPRWDSFWKTSERNILICVMQFG